MVEAAARLVAVVDDLVLDVEVEAEVTDIGRPRHAVGAI
jgi:hypothetical protein